MCQVVSDTVTLSSSPLLPSRLFASRFPLRLSLVRIKHWIYPASHDSTVDSIVQYCLPSPSSPPLLVAGAATVSAVCRHDRRPPDRLPPPPVWSHHVDFAAVAAALCCPLAGLPAACLSVCLSVSVCCCMSIGRPVRLVPLVLSCCSSRLATWSASVGCSPVATRTEPRSSLRRTRGAPGAFQLDDPP